MELIIIKDIYKILVCVMVDMMTSKEQQTMLRNVKNRISDLKRRRKKCQKDLMNAIDEDDKKRKRRELNITSMSLEDWTKFLKRLSK